LVFKLQETAEAGGGIMNFYSEGWNKWPLPIVPISEKLNPFERDGVELSAALMNHMPYENVKFLTVYGLLLGAKEKLKSVNTLVEATSGNTGIVLAAMAKSFGVSHVKLVVSQDLPDGKRYPLIMSGAELVPPDENLSAIATARKLGELDGYFNVDQYGNLDGTFLHERFTGPKIFGKLSYPPTVFVAGVGTGGTIIGISKYLRRKVHSVTIVGVFLSLGQEIPGVRDLVRMKEITLPWRESLDEIVEIETRPSYLASLWFNWIMGITPGPSSGFAYLGALKFLNLQKKSGALDSLRDDQGRINVVILFPDSNRPYGDRFTANLPTNCFRSSTAPLPWNLPGHELW